MSRVTRITRVGPLRFLAGLVLLAGIFAEAAPSSAADCADRES